jgi:deaminated glutathione amidase
LVAYWFYSLMAKQILFLPEAADYIAQNAQESLSLAVPQGESPFVRGLQDAAKKHSLAINVGIHVPVTAAKTPGASDTVHHKLFNRSLWINNDGSINKPGTYDKLHVFDYGALKESATVQGGSKLTKPFDTPAGRVGSLICFDLRFAEPAIALTQPGKGSPFAGTPAQILTYPSAFTIRTGTAHWELLLRARAIETQSWVIASAQVGRHNDKRCSYGHSMAVDPWGKIVLELGGVDSEGNAESGAEDAIGFVEIDLEALAQVREEMPLRRRGYVLTTFLS